MRTAALGIWLLLSACWLAAAPLTPPQAGEDRAAAERLYQQGMDLLNRSRWDEAARAFDGAARQRGPRVEGALYWRAYALHKGGKGRLALAVLDELQRSSPRSSWLDDAASLRTEIQLAAGMAVDSSAQTGDESMLLALSSLLHTDQDRVVQQLDRYLRSDASPALKEQALLLLAQCTSPRARTLLAEVSRGATLPGLQLQAIRHLGSLGSGENRRLLEEVYRSSTDPEVKAAALHGLMVAGDVERLFAVARSERDPGLRRSAIQWLGTRRAAEQLRKLYGSAPQDKEAVLTAMAAARQLEDLARIAADGREPQSLRRIAARHLGSLRGVDAGRLEKALTAIYERETDRELRRAALEGLAIQRRDQALIAIARGERDPELRRAALQGLSRIGSREALEFLSGLAQPKETP